MSLLAALVGPLQYKKDKDNKDILTDKLSGNHQVMMEWEKPYMEALVKKLRPSGDVLEIGFGLGYSSNAIQKYNIKTHTIIECDPEVLKKLRTWAPRQRHKVRIIEGAWQEKLPLMHRRFDSFFIDDYPSAAYPDPYDTRFFNFYYQIMKNNVNKNARFTWFSSRPLTWPCTTWTKWDCEEYNINVPENVNYIDDVKAKELYLPLITFKYSSPLDIHPIILDKFIKANES